jgi:hypothetical protein
MKRYCPTPSSAVRAMVNGLRNQDRRADFQVDMGSFGLVHRGVCFGCAATCALQEATGRNFTVRDITEHCLSDWELMIDGLRSGFVKGLLNYYEVDSFDFDLPYLSTENWRDNLEPYERLATYLESIDL